MIKKDDNIVRFPMRKLTGEIEVKISDRANNQIKYLCSRIADVEWSGVLFYSIADTNVALQDYKVTLEYIFPMDKGSAGYTEYEIEGDNVIAFRMDNPEVNKWHIGHIHSHNNMKSYFSGTDMDELNLNSRNHNNYLSIVVNNRHEIVGKLSFVAESDTGSKFSYTSVAGKLKSFVIGKSQKTMFHYDCKIVKDRFTISKDFVGYVDKIIKKATIKKESASHMGFNRPENSFGHNQLELPMSNFSHGSGFKNNEPLDEEQDWQDELPQFLVNDGSLIEIENFSFDQILKSNMLHNNENINEYAKRVCESIEGYVNDYFNNFPTLFYSEASLAEIIETTIDVMELESENSHRVATFVEHLQQLLIISYN